MTWLPLATGGLDRAAHRRRDSEWLDRAWVESRVVVVCDGKALVHGDEGRGDADKTELVLVGPEEVPAGTQRYFLGVDDDQVAYFAVGAPLPELPGTRPGVLREVGHTMSDRDSGIFATAIALDSWHQRHRYCPVTGAPTVLAEGGWTRVTADGSQTLWPRTDPAAIVMVHDAVAGPEGRCLLARNAAWQPVDGLRRYSCLAGFVEPGETAEQAAKREVYEEVGVAVREVRYVASQPWPFPGSLMLGFVALADPADPVRIDPDEIAEARWCTRTQVRAALAGDQDAVFGLPMGLSIARYLITGWATSGDEFGYPR